MGVLDRFILVDDQWERMSAYIIDDARTRGSSGRDNRMFIEALLWIVRTGSPWHDLTEVFGEWNSIFRRFSRWSHKGILWRIFAAMSDDPDFEYSVDTAGVQSARLPEADRNRFSISGAARIEIRLVGLLHRLMGEVPAARDFLGVAWNVERTCSVGGDQGCDRDERMGMDALIAVRGVDAEGRQRRAHIVPRLDGRGGIRAIVAEYVLLERNVVLAAQCDQLAGQMIVEGAGLVGHGDGDAEFR